MDKCLKAKTAAGVLLAMFIVNNSHAEITWNGFLSVGGGIISPDEGDSIPDFDYEKDLTFATPTRLGLQLQADISDKVSATGQIVARGNEDYNPDMAWAYLSYAASDKVTFRMGRFRTPFYLYSDFLEVGYAYHWITPPDYVYSLPADSIDGVDMVFNTPMGATDFSVQVYAGSADVKTEGTDIDYNTKVRNQLGLVLSLNYEWLTLRLSQHQAEKVSLEGLEQFQLTEDMTLGGLQGQLYQLGQISPPATDGYTYAADRLLVDDDKFTFTEAAIKVEWNNLLFAAEVTTLETGLSPLGEQKRSFVTAGYTFGPIMIHLTQTRSQDEAIDLTSSFPTDIPDPQTAAVLKGAVDLVTNSFADQDRTMNSIGMRLDFETSAAFKLEYSQIEHADSTNGTLIRFVVDTVF